MSNTPQVARSDADTVPATDEETRVQTYLAIANHIADVTGGATERSREIGKSVLEAVTEIIFTQVVQKGYFRFPDGYGTLKIAHLKRDPALKRIPTGKMVAMPKARVKMRYEEGAAVREVLGLPRRTNYVRRYSRRTKLSDKAREILTPPTV